MYSYINVNLQFSRKGLAKNLIPLYDCKSTVCPIWWIIDYPAKLEHWTNRLDVSRGEEPPRN